MIQSVNCAILIEIYQQQLITKKWKQVDLGHHQAKASVLKRNEQLSIEKQIQAQLKHPIHNLKRIKCQTSRLLFNTISQWIGGKQTRFLTGMNQLNTKGKQFMKKLCTWSHEIWFEAPRKSRNRVYPYIYVCLFWT